MNILKVSDFGFSYPAGVELFSKLGFSLEQGSFTLLVGATGSGKTTLLRSIKPELAPAGEKTGSVEVFGRDINTLTLYESSTTIGYVSQSPENQIVCDTVWHELAFGLENLGVAQDAMRRRVAEVAYFFGIEQWMNAATTRLSGGQKQAVTLASVLVMQPKLLLLDEPTAQLDPIAEKNFLHALFRANRELGITVVVATHAPATMLAYASEALCLSEGRIQQVKLSEFDYESRLYKSDTGSDVEQEVEKKATGTSDGSHEKPNVSLCEQVAGGESHKEQSVLLHDVFFRYTQDSSWVVRGIDFSAACASIHAVIGGNGSGKSTLLQMIAGVLKPQLGKIKNSLLLSQALLPQNPKTLFNCDSVQEELGEWQKRCGYSQEEIARVVQQFALEAHLGQHPYDLSGGQQQKLALAKLLLTKATLLLLDEPTKGLDAGSKCEIAEILHRLRDEGKTIILATHDLSFISQVADTATMLFDGQTACSEPIADFFIQNIFYRPQADEFMLCWQQRSESQDKGGYKDAPKASVLTVAPEASE